MVKILKLASIMRRTIIPVGALSITLVVAVSWFGARGIIKENIRRHTELLTQTIIGQVEGIDADVRQIASAVSGTLAERHLSEEDLASYLHELLTENPVLFSVGVTYEPYGFREDLRDFGISYMRTETDIERTDATADYGADYRLQDWHQVPVLTGRSIWMEPYYAKRGDDLMTSFCTPFSSDGTDSVSGVLVLGISLRSLSESAGRIRILDSGYGAIISAQGTHIAHPDRDLVMNETLFTLADELKMDNLRELGHRMVSGEKGMMETVSIVTGKKSMISYAPFARSGWSLAIIVPLSEMYSGLNRLDMMTLILAAAGLGVLFLIVGILAGRITEPLKVLSSVTADLGEGKLDVRVPEVSGAEEIVSLNRTFRSMQENLKGYIETLKQSVSRIERAETELAIAREIQMSIIPKSFPAFPERKDMDIFALINPAKAVGGDLYDFFFVEDDLLAFTLGDVSGKGVPASLFMAVTRTLFRSGMKPGPAVKDLIWKMNETLVQNNDASMFVTLFAGVLDLRTGLLEYCNAGHNPPVLLRADGSQSWLDERHGLPLGVMDGMDYESAELQMEPGDMLFLYTDGVTEAENRDKELYGEDRLENSLGRPELERTPHAIIERIEESVSAFTRGAEQSDDITMLCLKISGGTEERKTGDGKMNLKKKSFSFRNDLEELAALGDKLERLGEEWQLPDLLVKNVNLVLEELITNTIFYGISDGKVHEIITEFLYSGGDLSVSIMDDGIEFNPFAQDAPDVAADLEDRPIGGLGIFLVKSMTEGAEYRRRDGMNIITMKMKN